MPGAAPGLHEREQIFRAQAEDVVGNRPAAETVFCYPVSVSGNWRVTFRFEDGHAVDVKYADYH